MVEASPRRKRIAYFLGADAHDGGIPKDGATTRFPGNSDLAKLGMYDRLTFKPLTMTKNYFRQNQRIDLRPYDCIVNLVTDPDQTPKVLANLERLLKPYPRPVINPPAKVMRTSREHVAQRLAGTEGLIVPPTIRLRSNKPAIVLKALATGGIRFPAIVREAGTHGGKIIGLFDTAEDVAAALHAKSDHFVTSFHDFRSADGLYRKYRVFFFGDRPVVRHFLVDEKWNIHGRSRESFMAARPDIIAEENRHVETGLPEAATATLHRVRERMGLDFFGIDFGMTADDELILFEANATMNFFPFIEDKLFAYVRACLPPSREAFHQMLQASLARAPAPAPPSRRPVQRPRPGFRAR